MNKALFLDRDGVINCERGEYTYKSEDFRFNENLFELLRIFHEHGFFLIVITNQGGIDKKLYTHQDVMRLHNKFVAEALTHGIVITDIYYCPHHDQLQKCLCRKPGTLMLEKAMARYRIDPQRSYFIGDTERDIECAQKMGVTPIKIEPNVIDIQKILSIAKIE